ncbi:heavy metal translocating P-type ATPase [Methanobacterium aggregans]|uniref:heavy metal translocating P-type ATPase n=1 Tax=Methanobacterium aggregans TaxID=1615586 RepID=UPI001AEA3304|nr:cation-translocating P-type ATPase [Methanobacterium aggregans]MBP2045008.1 Cd2+/Zn2+-exporting ATPase [Methanobacterium aggregans]
MPENADKHENHTSCSCSCQEDVFEERESIWNRKNIAIITSSAVLLTIGILLENFTGHQLIAQVLFLMVVLISGYEIIKEGIEELLGGEFSIDLLITIAAVGAFLIGHGVEGASVVFLFFIAEFLESYAGERARNSMASLLKIAPETATVKKGDSEEVLHAHEVEVGNMVVVKPGDKIPLDGIVINGASSVNQAPITGESMPVGKYPGLTVFAGTINQEGYLEIEVTKRSTETVISRIIELVKESQKNKSKTEAFITRFARYYTPTVILAAAVVATVPPLIFGLSFEEWFYRALVLLVVSCPCALAISTPVSMVSGITSATKNGVLIKGGQFIEEMQNVKLMVFDKTGTLTEGKLEVTDVKSFNNHSQREVLEVAASLESRSKHPLAEPILKMAQKEKISLKDVSDFKSIAGKGITGKIDDKIFYAGKNSMMDGLEVPGSDVTEFEENGKTVVLIADHHHVIGLIGLRDKIRENAEKTVQKLKNQGIKTVMLTGDNEGTARAVSSQIGIDKYYSGLLPEDKVRIVEKLLEEGQVGMVGDGVNDAPALAKSNVGIAMGAAGSDVAIETADVALMHDDLSKLNYMMKLSKKTMAIVKENVTVSILVKSSFAVLAVFGFVTLWMAVAFGDMGLSLAVILNALRIGNGKIVN